MTGTLMPASQPLERLQPETLKSGAEPVELAAVEDLVHQARQAGIALTGPDGLLKAMARLSSRPRLGEQMADDLGYDNTRSRAGTGQLPQREAVGDPIGDRIDDAW